jgi:4-hydroxythreonine-4-phosphate dehydrogenase
MTTRLPLLITLGDVAGIGPEIVVKAWPRLVEFCRPVVVGDRLWLERAIALCRSRLALQVVERLAEAAPAGERLVCLAGSNQDLGAVQPGRVSAAAGRAAYDFLCTAIDRTLAGEAAGIVTAPLHKEGLKAAGLPFPGHTEVLAQRTGAPRHAMLLYAPAPRAELRPTEVRRQDGRTDRPGLAVAHVTLHMALREVFGSITSEAVGEKIRLLAEMCPRLGVSRPRIAVAALNPHASDGGRFGDEEDRHLRPAVEAARRDGIDVTGPWPSDTLFVRAVQGDFDGIVAMYHDAGHIAMKLLAGRRLVNITAGLPIVRTSVAHGTAYDIAWRGLADETSLLEAARVAVLLTEGRRG